MSEDKVLWVGHDKREEDAYNVCLHTAIKHTPDLHIVPTTTDVLRGRHVYRRPKDEPASTEFTYSRFWLPFLREFKGHALFCDCDFMFTRDLTELYDLFDPKYAVQVVKHDYTPKSILKMDGQKQVNYPRKNWSSLMLFNCEHPANKQLNLEYLNGASAQDLHRFAWLNDSEIGELPGEWNWLEGDEEVLPHLPAGVHYTNGGPWFKGHEYVQYADIWRAELLHQKAGYTITGKYAEMNWNLHQEVPHYGVTAGQHFTKILNAAKKFECRSILDYGCGKRVFFNMLKGSRHNGDFSVREFDPCLPEFRIAPPPCDLVISIDVLEHVEPICIDSVIRHLKSLTRKAAFFTISLRESSKVLADGSNAHRLVKPFGWWKQKLAESFKVESAANVNQTGFFVLTPL